MQGTGTSISFFSLPTPFFYRKFITRTGSNDFSHSAIHVYVLRIYTCVCVWKNVDYNSMKSRIRIPFWTIKRCHDYYSRERKFAKRDDAIYP